MLSSRTRCRGRPRLLLLDELSLELAPMIAAALEVADRGVVLAHGEVTTQGDASILRSDRNLLVAGYLGGSAEAPPPPPPSA
jgi:ABC-type branched-subunit amino acid transport system ATPase component